MRAEVAQVAVLLGRPADEFAAPAFPEVEVDGVEKRIVREDVAELLEAVGQAAGKVMHAAGYLAQAFRSVINGIHRGHDREEHLGRADVARRLVAPDVLLARLERETVGRPSGGIVRNTDQASRQVALVLVAGGEISGVRPAPA